jgi:hypothetical protein
VSLVEADGGKLQVRGWHFGSDEPCIALRPGLKHAIVSEDDSVPRRCSTLCHPSNRGSQFHLM